jgi:integrase
MAALGIGSQRNAWQLVAKALNAAVREGIFDVSPLARASLTRPSKKRQRAIQVLTVAEVERLAQAATSDRDAVMFRVMAYAGLRIGEASGLRAEDIDVERCRIRVEQIVVRTHGGKAVGPPKTDWSRRTIRVSCSLVQDLARYMEAYPPQPDGRIFATESGGYVDDRKFNTALKRAAARAGVPVGHSHELRHTFAALNIAAGVGAKAISVAMGHSSITITMDTYGHLFGEAGEETAAAVDRMLEAHANGA